LSSTRASGSVVFRAKPPRGYQRDSLSSPSNSFSPGTTAPMATATDSGPETQQEYRRALALLGQRVTATQRLSTVQQMYGQGVLTPPGSSRLSSAGSSRSVSTTAREPAATVTIEQTTQQPHDLGRWEDLPSSNVAATGRRPGSARRPSGVDGTGGRRAPGNSVSPYQAGRSLSPSPSRQRGSRPLSAPSIRHDNDHGPGYWDRRGATSRLYSSRRKVGTVRQSQAAASTSACHMSTLPWSVATLPCHSATSPISSPSHVNLARYSRNIRIVHELILASAPPMPLHNYAAIVTPCNNGCRGLCTGLPHYSPPQRRDCRRCSGGCARDRRPVGSLHGQAQPAICCTARLGH